MKHVFAFVALCLLSACQTRAGELFDVAIINVTVTSPERDAPLGRANVYLQGERIAAIDTAAHPRPARNVIDGEGRYLIPGLIDSHVHVSHLIGLTGRQARERPALAQAVREQTPRAYLYFGFTTLIDLDLAPDDAALFNAAPLRPTLLSCGRGVRLANGYGMNFVEGDERFDVFPNFVIENDQDGLPASIDRAEHTPEAAVRMAASAGAVCIKTYYERGFSGVFDLPVPSDVTLTRLRAAAHDENLPLVLHATSLEGYRAGLASDADIFAHGLWHWPGSLTADLPADVAQTLQDAVAHGAYVQPTMRVLYGEAAEMTGHAATDPLLEAAIGAEMAAFLRDGGAAWSLEELNDAYARSDLRGDLSNEQAIAIFTARVDNLVRALSAQRARLIFGSDTPAVRGGGNVPGLNGSRELESWAAAGVPLREILVAATLRNAEAFGLDADIGAITAGRRADLLLLSADPLQSIAAYQAIDQVIVGGRVIERRTLAADHR